MPSATQAFSLWTQKVWRRSWTRLTTPGSSMPARHFAASNRPLSQLLAIAVPLSVEKK